MDVARKYLCFHKILVLVKPYCSKYARSIEPVSSLLPCAMGTKSFLNDGFGFKITSKLLI